MYTILAYLGKLIIVAIQRMKIIAWFLGYQSQTTVDIFSYDWNWFICHKNSVDSILFI